MKRDDGDISTSVRPRCPFGDRPAGHIAVPSDLEIAGAAEETLHDKEG